MHRGRPGKQNLQELLGYNLPRIVSLAVRSNIMSTPIQESFNVNNGWAREARLEVDEFVKIVMGFIAKQLN